MLTPFGVHEFTSLKSYQSSFTSRAHRHPQRVINNTLLQDRTIDYFLRVIGYRRQIRQNS
jgi:hypothetical protein